MKGAARRLILAQGSTYTVRNATGEGGRNTPSYEDDGTLTGILEQRPGMPNTTRDSSGREVEASLNIRAIVDGTTIRTADDTSGYPTRLVHPSGATYEVVDSHLEDSGVTVMMVVEV